MAHNPPAYFAKILATEILDAVTPDCREICVYADYTHLHRHQAVIRLEHKGLFCRQLNLRGRRKVALLLLMSLEPLFRPGPHPFILLRNN